MPGVKYIQRKAKTVFQNLKYRNLWTTPTEPQGWKPIKPTITKNACPKYAAPDFLKETY